MTPYQAREQLRQQGWKSIVDVPANAGRLSLWEKAGYCGVLLMESVHQNGPRAQFYIPVAELPPPAKP